MSKSDLPSPQTPVGYSPAGLAKRAASVLRRAGQAVWRPTQDNTAATPHAQAVSIARLTERLRKHISSADLTLIKEAYRYADSAHLGQFRRSGEPYITHPIAVAEILADWKLDAAAIQAALLHDVLEDTGIRKQELTERFGTNVAELVDGVSKLDRLRFDSTEQQQAESFRKMLLAMARDVRVILIKLADRLHNVRTLGAMSVEKQHRIARETLDVYAPIAHRLGLNALYRELQDECFSRLHPMRYAVLSKAVLAARGNRREVLSKIHEGVSKALTQHKLKAEVFGREKTLYGIYRKMVEKRLSFSEVLDIYGFRIVVNTRTECYLALGALHALFRPVPGKFKDYIAIPKENGYQSLHTTLVGPYGAPVEFQIRTRLMHQVAESGVASHWLYKSDDASATELQTKMNQWLQSLIEIQAQTGDSAEFMENIKVDLFPEKVYVFTPKGKIMSLPRGSTLVDFAYGIHTDVGNRTVAARVNTEMQPLRTLLKNGDTVEIVTGPIARPNPTWLSFVRTGKARAEIRHFLRNTKREEAVDLGHRLLEQAFMQLDRQMPEATPARWEAFIQESNAHSQDEVLADIGLGQRLAPIVARQLLQISTDGLHDENDADARKALTNATPVVIRGTEGMALSMANCCSPIPGDLVVGHMRRDQGLAVHRADCANARRSRRADPDRWLDLQWAADTAGHFSTNVDVITDNERGVLGRVAVAIAEADSNILNVSVEDEGAEMATIHFKLQVKDRQHLARAMRMIRRVKQVNKVTRVRPLGKTTAHEV